MDIKQKKKFLTLIFKTLLVLSLCAGAWVAYYCINALVQNSGILWLNTTLVTLVLFSVLALLILAHRMIRNKNLYAIGNYIFVLVLMSFAGIVAGVYYLYYTNYKLATGEYLTCVILMLMHVILASMLYVAVKINKLNKKTSIQIDSISEVPNYDDEISLKKKLDELNRKLEMKKVAEKIEAMQKELDEN